MKKTKYEVILPWYGVERGDTVEFETVPNALKANVRPIGGKAANRAKEAADTLAAAKAEAEKIVADARAEAEKIVADARAEAEKISADAKGNLTPATPSKK